MSATPQVSRAPSVPKSSIAETKKRQPKQGGPFRFLPNLSLNVVMALLLIYSLLPLFWLLVNATKSNADLFGSFGLWFGHEFSLWQNIHDVFTQQGGIFGRWLINTVIYALVGAGGASILAALGGYALAHYSFPMKRTLFATVLGAIMIPGTALAVPTYLLLSQVDLVNTPWAVILPSLVSPFGLYLMRVYAFDAVPISLIEAARIDGASEFAIFRTIAMRLLAPGLVTVFLFQLVQVWNNYFLPLIVLNDSDYFPVTVGLVVWNTQANGGSETEVVFPLVLAGALVALVPLVVAFLFLQRFWESGLATGAVKE